MNKHCYRVIFNRTRGLFQVVAEIARRHRRDGARGAGAGGIDPSGVGKSTSVIAVIRPLTFALWVMLGSAAVDRAALAQIVADPNAPGNQQPTVLTAPNGVPLVNIQTPSEAGVSRNAYTQFDVGREGAILNNASGHVQTELGGWVQGNPWLGDGAASVILNEVNSSDPSLLHGFVEIAGGRAELVIANPSGISCDGCGFINASRSTLTTGVPVMGAAGSLESYRVGVGAIQIHGKGLNASGTDHTDLISRSMVINAGIWAKRLRVTTGVNDVSADHTVIDAKAGEGEAPAFAVDVGSLGGMYSQKIMLLGTEHGVGVRNAGTLGAQAGGLIVTTGGRLENSGTLQATVDASVTASGGIANAGLLSAAREITLSTPSDVDNGGGSVNARRVEINAQSLRNRDGAIEQTGGQDLLLHAGAATNREGGRIGLAEVASAEPDGTDSGVGAGKPRSDMPGETTQAASPQPGEPLADLADGALNIVGTLDNDGGRIFAGGKIDVELATGLDNSAGHLGVRQLDIGGGDLHNRGGELKVADKVRIQAGQLNNDAGSMQLAGLLTLHAENLSNRSGILAHSGTDDTRLHVKETLDNHEGTLASNAGRLIIQGKALVNTDGQLRHAGEKGLVVRVDKFSGAAGHMATAGAAELKLGEVDHRRAKLSATQVEIDAASFDNRGGEIVATAAGSNRMNVAGMLDNGQAGRIASNGELTIHAATLGNAGGTVQQANDGRLTIVADTLSGAGGTIVGNGALAVTGKHTDLSYGTTYAKNIKIETDHLSTAGGKLSASGTDTLDLKVAGTFDNTRGDVTAAADIFLRAGELQNNAGAIVTAGRSSLQLNVDGRIDNNDDGTLAGGGDMSLRANALSNRKGSIQHAGDGTLSIRAVSLDGKDGSIASNAALQLRGGDIDLSGATTQASKIGIDAGSLSTVGGKLTALSDSVLDLVVSGAFDNAGGAVASNGMLALRAKSLRNLGGKFSMAGVEASKITVADMAATTHHDHV